MRTTKNPILKTSKVISSFDKPTVQSIMHTAVSSLNAMLKDYGVSVESRGGKFSSTEATMRFRFVLPVDVQTVQVRAKELSVEMVRNGYATRGMQLMFRGRKVMIHEARRKKYVFSYVGEDTKYTASFFAFTI